MATWTPQSVAFGPLPVLGWTGGALQLSAYQITSVTRYTTIQPVLGDSVLLRLARFGTLTADCTAAIEFGIDDNQQNFGEAQAWTNAQINNANNLTARVPAAGKFYRLRFDPGTTTGTGNGLQVSART